MPIMNEFRLFLDNNRVELNSVKELGNIIKL